MRAKPLVRRRPPLAALLYGLLLATMAAGQLASLGAFEDALASYELLGGLLPAAVLALPALELLAAVGLLGSRVLPRPALRAVGILGILAAVAWSLLAVQAFARGLDVDNCGCFGAYLAQELRWWVLLEDAYQLLLSLLAARSLERLRAVQPPSFRPSSRTRLTTWAAKSGFGGGSSPPRPRSAPSVERKEP